MQKTHFNFLYFVLALTGLLLLQIVLQSTMVAEPVAYSAFEKLLRDGKVERVDIFDRRIDAVLKEPLADGRRTISTVRIDTELAKSLAAYDVTFSGVIESTWMRDLLSWIVPIVLMFLLWTFILNRVADRQGLGGAMAIGRSKAKVYVEKDTKVTFEDVAGVDEAKEELKEVVTFLKDPKAYGRLGARIPKGVLLVGAPGTGKTLLARAVAGEAGVPFFSINGSEFVEMFVGVGAARVRDLFDQARKSAPCIIFIDELDALGRARGISPVGGGADEKEQTLNQLLSELDGFDSAVGVVLLAATNRPEILDPALLRAGRFDRQVPLDRPDKTGRRAILLVHLKKIKLAADVDPEQIAALTPGFTGADLANLANEAAIVATRRHAEEVNADDFVRAIERILAGPEKKNRLLNPIERHVVAVHETGHALVALALPGIDPVQKISIIPRGIGSLGYTIQRPIEDRYLMTRPELENKMAVLLGGRAAEALVFGELSTGAADDLRKATEIARGMVMHYGMDDTLGNAIYGEEAPRYLGAPPQAGLEFRNFSEETAGAIDRAVRLLLAGALDRARAILAANRGLLDEKSQALLKAETLSAADLPKPVWHEGTDRRTLTPAA